MFENLFDPEEKERVRKAKIRIKMEEQEFKAKEKLIEYIFMMLKQNRLKVESISEEKIVFVKKEISLGQT